jgi:hypothetical protein
MCRLEKGDPSVSLRTRFRVAALLGGDLRLTAYEGSGALIRDSVQANIMEQLLGMRNPGWRPTLEADVPGAGRRSVDLRLDSSTAIVLIEVETRLASLEEIVRELHAKRAAFMDAAPGGSRLPVHLVLALPVTRLHALVADHPQIIRSAFPTPSAAIRRALVSPPAPWPGDGILWMRREPNVLFRST